MRVGIEGQRDLTVSESLHDDTRVNSLRQQERRCGVAEVMDAERWQPRCLQHRLENSPNIPFIKRCADGGREHQPGIYPSGPGEQALSPLPFLLALQRFERETRERNGSSAPFALGFHEAQLLPNTLKDRRHR